MASSTTFFQNVSQLVSTHASPKHPQSVTGFLMASINEGMSIPEDAPHDEYKTTLNYKNKNTGEVKEFDETNYPWQDTLN